MTEEVDGCLGKFAFLRVERYSREHRSQPGVVLCPVAPEHQYIVHLAHYTAEACQDSGHALLKVFRCTGDPEWLFVETIPPRWCDERGQQVRGRREGDLPETTVCVQLGEQLGSSQLGKGVVHLREGGGLLVARSG